MWRKIFASLCGCFAHFASQLTAFNERIGKVRQPAQNLSRLWSNRPLNKPTSTTVNHMSVRKNFNTPRAPRMSDAFPQSVIADNFIFLSGMPGLDPTTGQVTSSDFEQQVRQSFENIRAVLEDAGSSLPQVVKTTIFMVTGNDFSVINKVYKEFFPESPPARSTPQVMPFPAGILVSVECIAQT